MEKEKMIDLWKKEFEQGYFSYNFPPSVYEYFDGKADKPFPDGYIPRKQYAAYEKWIQKELDGENGELARQMLYVISLIRTQGPIYQYNIEEELDVCIRINYGFEDILKAVLKISKDLTLPVLYGLAEKLTDCFPQETEEFAEKLLSNKIDEIASKRKSSSEFYLIVYTALIQVKKAPSKADKYIPAIMINIQKYKGRQMLALLYYGKDISEELKSVLIGQINTNPSSANVWLEVMKADEFLPFLKELGTRLWSYYYLVIRNEIRGKDRAKIFNDLFGQDRETFMELFERLSGANEPMNKVLSGYLLAILLKNGITQGIEEKGDLIALSVFKGLFNEYAEDKTVSFTQLADEKIPLSEIDKVTFRNIWWGANGTEYIQVAALLYNNYAKARRMFGVLFQKSARTNNNYNNPHIAVCFFLSARKEWLGIPVENSLLSLMEPEIGYTIQNVFQTYCFTQNGYYSLRGFEEVMTTDTVKNNQQIVLEVLKGGKLSIEETLTLLNLAYEEYKMSDNQPLLQMLSNKSKMIRKRAEELIIEREESVRPALEEGTEKWKGEARAIAKRVIKRWDNERKYGADFNFANNQMVVDFCNDNYDEDNSRFISWIPEDMLTDVRFADLTEKAPAVVLKYILSEYLSLEESYRIKICDKVAEQLCSSDLQAALENIYRLWMDNGAEAKKKMIMVPYCVYASDTQILKLKTQLKDWAEASRGAVAAFVVNAIALNGGSVALMMIDGISIKFPNNQVKNAAKAAFSFAAKALEIPEDELSDKIVPTLGFNREGEKVLDYGGRTFKITLMPDFSLSIYDNDKQKKIKSMPAPAASDDPVKATAAKKEFSELKKQMKATVQSQTNRLEKVLMNGRKWNVSAWETLFVENPVMHCFAMGLIWGVYENDVLTDTFRYMEDGTFNTVDEDEYTLPEKAFITLVHPVELSTELLNQWKEQLDDYEIIQPIPQLTASVEKTMETDVKDKKLIRYNGVVTQSGKIAGIARKHNMVRGDVLDGGSFTAFHWVDKFLNIDVLLQFEYMWMGQEYNENVTLGEVIFYKLDEDQGVTDEPNEKNYISPAELPTRFLSTVLGIFEQLVEQ